MINPPTDAKADEVADRLAELGDYVRDLRHAVEHHRIDKIYGAMYDIACGTIRAGVANDYHAAIGELLRAIENTMRFSPTRHDRIAAGCMVSCIEAILERDAGER